MWCALCVPASSSSQLLLLCCCMILNCNIPTRHSLDLLVWTWTDCTPNYTRAQNFTHTSLTRNMGMSNRTAAYSSEGKNIGVSGIAMHKVHACETRRIETRGVMQFVQRLFGLLWR